MQLSPTITPSPLPQVQPELHPYPKPNFLQPLVQPQLFQAVQQLRPQPPTLAIPSRHLPSPHNAPSVIAGVLLGASAEWKISCNVSFVFQILKMLLTDFYRYIGIVYYVDMYMFYRNTGIF